MKLSEAKKITSDRLSVLNQQRLQLTNLMNQGSNTVLQNGANFDRVEISKLISSIDEEYEQVSNIMERLSTKHHNIQSAEISRQQAEAVAEQVEEVLKMLEVYRRISKGGKVPPTDEQRLMQYSIEMYMSAKNMALMNKGRDSEEYDSLWGDEQNEEFVDPTELADNKEVGNPLSEVSSSVSSSVSEVLTGLE